MAATKITVNTNAYTRTHQQAPQGKGMWAFTIDAAEKVTVKYGEYKEAIAWAKAQATATVKVLP